MGYFLLYYETVDNYVEKRAPYRAQHLELARDAHARGELLLAGALADPADGADEPENECLRGKWGGIFLA